MVGCPQGVTGCRPPDERPSPPPCGWSTGFIATPLTVGLTPRQRLGGLPHCLRHAADGRKLAVAADRGPWGFKPALDQTKAWLAAYKKTGQEPDLGAQARTQDLLSTRCPDPHLFGLRLAQRRERRRLCTVRDEL